MDTNITMVQGDASPSRVFEFVRQDGTIPDLSNAQSVDFIIIRPDTGAQTNTGGTACVIQTPGTLGQAQYNWHTADLPVEGVYRCLLRITDSDAKPETNIVYVTVESDTK